MFIERMIKMFVIVTITQEDYANINNFEYCATYSKPNCLIRLFYKYVNNIRLESREACIMNISCIKIILK